MPAPIALVTGSLPPHDVCGVGDYTRCLFDELEKVQPVDLLHIPIRRPVEAELLRVFRGREIVHVEYPTEGWGKSVLPSFLPMARSLYGRQARLLLTLHEWSQMNRVRRASILPLVARADAFIFVTSHEREAFLSSAPAAARSKPSWVIPIGVNLQVPVVPSEEVLAFRDELLDGGKFDLLVTHFGFIHAGKQPGKLLDTIVALREAGRRPRLVLVGGFQQDKQGEREAFEREIAARGIADAVKFTGFVEDEKLAALYMASGDVNVSLFADGLSSRRGSFWYSTQHGCALVTTSPTDWRDFERVKDSLRPPHVNFVQKDASAKEIADAVLSIEPYAPFRYPRVPVEQWSDIARLHGEVYAALRATSS